MYSCDNRLVYDVELKTSFLNAKGCTSVPTAGEDSGSYVPADSTFSHRRTLEIIVTTFGSLRVIRLSGAVIVGVIMAMGTIFHHLVKSEMF